MCIRDRYDSGDPPLVDPSAPAPLPVQHAAPIARSSELQRRSRTRWPTPRLHTARDLARAHLAAPAPAAWQPHTVMSAPIVFKFPADGYQTVLALGLFLYVDQAAPGTFGASIRNAVGGQRVLDWIRALTVLAHLGEAIAMLVVCLKRGAPPLTLVRTPPLHHQRLLTGAAEMGGDYVCRGLPLVDLLLWCALCNCRTATDTLVPLVYCTLYTIPKYPYQP